MEERKAKSYFIGGIFISLAGAICFSTKAVLVKMAYANTTADALTLLALRMLFSLPFFVISAVVASRIRGRQKPGPRLWIMVALTGVLGYYVSSYLDFRGLEYVTASIERLILFVYPTLVLVISAVVLRHKIETRQWLAVAITYAGLLLAFVSDVHRTDNNRMFYTGALLIFLCAITFAVYILLSGSLTRKLGTLLFNSYAMSFACLGVLLHHSIASDSSLLGLSNEIYVYGLVMGLVSTVIPSYLVTEGVRRIGPGNAAIIGSVGPVSTLLQANLLLGESITIAEMVGTVLILCGVLMIGKANASGGTAVASENVVTVSGGKNAGSGRKND